MRSSTCLLVSLTITVVTAGSVQALDRGDADGSGVVDISDAVRVLNYLFLGGDSPLCDAVADSNADGVLNIGDAIFALAFLFQGGPTPEPLTPEEEATCLGGPDPAAIERGEAVYGSPDPAGNGFSCSTCHARAPDGEDELIRPASSLHDALARPNYKLGQLEIFIDAANTCRVHWMETDPWTPESADLSDLTAFLTSITPPGPAPVVVYTIAPPAIEGDAPGDATSGCELFHRTCVICHGPEGQGTTLAPNITAFPAPADFIRTKARLSGPLDTVYEGLGGGLMPFWSVEDLDDGQLEDIVTYLTTAPLVDCGD